MTFWQFILYWMVLAPCIESFNITRGGDCLPLSVDELEHLERIVGNHINENPHDDTGIALLKKIEQLIDSRRRE